MSLQSWRMIIFPEDGWNPNPSQSDKYLQRKPVINGPYFLDSTPYHQTIAVGLSAIFLQ